MFLENPKKYSDFKALKIPKLLAQYPKNYKLYWKRFGNFSFLLDMENEQTQKYQNFISAQNIPEDPESEFYTLKNTTSIPINLPWKCPPRGEQN